MPRILVDLSAEDIDWLDRLAAEQGKSRAAMLRDAVASYRGQAIATADRGFGLWREHGFSEDGLAFQRRQREGN
jgi:hypothetical protein